MSPPDEPEPAALDLALALPRPALVIQESPRVTVTLTNGGPAPVTVANPRLHPEWPTMEVRGPDDEVRTYVPEDLRRRPPIPEHPGERFTVELAPGAARRDTFCLLERLALPRVGRHEVTAVELVGDLWVRSSPASVEVLPLRPRATTAPVSEGERRWSMAWVQEGEPASLHVRGLRAARGAVAVVGAFQAAAPVDPEARPVLSAPPPGSAAPARFAAWMDGSSLRWLDVGGEPAGPPEEVTLAAGARLLGPLALLDPERPRALAVARLRDAWLSAWVGQDAARGPQVPAPAPDPVWTDVLTGADRRAWVLSAGPGQAGVEVVATAWGEAGPEGPLALGVCKGTFVAGAARATAAGAVEGALVTWFAKRPGESPALLLTRWGVGVDGGPRMATPALWPWDRRWAAPTDVRLRLDPSGEPHLLVHVPEQGWLHGGPLQLPTPCPPGAREAAGPLDLVFVPGVGPVVLVVDPEAGLVGRSYQAQLEAEAP